MRIANPTARIGEDLAADYLRKQGYKIIERNFRRGYGEIDIIAIDGKTLVFIEVKTKTSLAFGDPLEEIGYFKLKTLTKGVQFYKMLHPELPEQMRIDAVSVLLIDNKPKIELIKNIAQPGLIG